MVEIEEVDEAAEAVEESAADKARAKAEARRKRILEESKERIGLVSGVQQNSTDQATTSTSAMSTEISVDEPKVDEESEKNADDHTANSTPASESSSKPSGSARLAAMRRRRFKKKAEATAATLNAGDAPVESKTAEVEDSTSSKPEDESAPTLVAETDSTSPTDGATEAGTKQSTESSKTEEETAHDKDAPKKKYKGVAHMRRKMLKEKQAREAEANKSTTSVAPAELPKKAQTSKLPIIFNIITVVVLFVAGLDIGLYQSVSTDVTIHKSRLAPQEHGAGLVRALSKSKVLSSQSTSSSRELLEQKTEEEWVTGADTSNDEFSKQKEVDYVPNIDPLFGVDLDVLTQGDTLFFALARCAVACHRINLLLFYHLPIKVFKTVLSIPRKLMATPPVLGLVALVVRQLAIRVLGAGLPAPESSVPREDVLQMMKNGVTNFLQSNIPTAVSMYTAFTHLRSDMYVVLCGFFVGLVLSHGGSSVLLPSGMSDEL